MKQQASIFLRNVTAIDYAHIDPVSFEPRGGSLHFSAIVTGNVDDHEAVVVDFSKIKKSIKSIIDDNEHGFDHKLWVPDSYNTKYKEIDVYEEGGDIQISTPSFNTICPTNAVRFVSFDDIDVGITAHLQTELELIYPKIGIKVISDITEDNFAPDSMRHCSIEFRYVHGLKNSSSWGCQNINHGHLSWLAICDKNNQGIWISKRWYSQLKAEINNAHFVWRDNILEDDGHGIKVGYESQRGWFESTYNQRGKLHILDTETTVENLAQWFVNKYRDELTSGEFKEKGAYSVWLSEGLTKGACAIIDP